MQVGSGSGGGGGGGGGGSDSQTQGLNFRIFTINVTFWSHFYESCVYVTNGFKTIRVHTVFFADAELLGQ